MNLRRAQPRVVWTLGRTSLIPSIGVCEPFSEGNAGGHAGLSTLSWYWRLGLCVQARGRCLALEPESRETADSSGFGDPTGANGVPGTGRTVSPSQVARSHYGAVARGSGALDRGAAC